MIGFVFPGQGTVRVGMGGWLRRQPAAADVFALADEVFDEPISTVCAKGPESKLIATEFAQPAVTVCNLAALAVLRDAGVEPALVAGHSVGELSALHAAGVFDLLTTLELVATRSRLMAALTEIGGMCAVMGLSVSTVEELAMQAATEDEPLVVGLENAPEHVVVSGALAAIDRLTGLAVEARKVVPLKVSNAFHSPLMAAATQSWAAAVRSAPATAPTIPVIPNVTAEPTTDLPTIIGALVAQLTERVRWTQTMTRLTDLTTCVEAGDSKVLAGLLRGTDVKCVSLADPTALRRLRRELAA